MTTDKYPGGSKTRVNLAGDRVRDNDYSSDDLCVIDAWRSAHREVLNTFQSIFRTHSKLKKFTVVQRHKRKNTIINKLKRYPNMKLSRMDDVAGCRLIFDSIIKLYVFRENFHNSRIKHGLKNDIDKYDYIKNPKQTGYRGVHDVYSYCVNSNHSHLNGLLIEIQYRTLVQHYWATAVEVIGHITESQPKFQMGDKRYEIAMAYASEILARAQEKMNGPYPTIDNHALLEHFNKLDNELGLMKMFRRLNKYKESIKKKKNLILKFDKDDKLEIESFKYMPAALERLFVLEKENPYLDVVLVKGDKSKDVRLAYTNYFRDASKFIKKMKDSIEILKTNEFK